MKTLLRSFLFLLLVYTTASSQWSPHHTFSNINFVSRPNPISENVVWGQVGFDNGLEGFFKTTDGGNSWYLDTLMKGITTGIIAIDENVAYCGGFDYSDVTRIIKTSDGGITWVTQNSAFGNSNFIDYIYFFDNNNGFALGDPIGGYLEIYTTTNGGDNWMRVPNTSIPQNLSNEFPINTAFSVVDNIIWVPVSIWGSNQVRIFKSTDRGYSWTASNQFSSTIVDLWPTSMAFKNQMDGLLILSRFYPSSLTVSTYKIFKTTNGGDNWSEIAPEIWIDPVFICGIPGTSQGYVVTAPINNIGSAYTFDGGNTWQLIEDSLDLCMPKFTSSSSGWAVSWSLDAANLYKWSGPELPVELNALTAKANGTEVTLNWSTATELNNYGFEIQRKASAGEFTTVAFVKGQGTTTQKNDYSFLDKDLDAGQYSYRLKQFDLDGKYEYSKIVEVEILSIISYSLGQNYPNPFNPSTTISYGLKEKSNVRLTILNSIGEEVAILVNQEQDKGYYNVEFNAANLSSGVYFYKLVAGNFIDTKKMILLR